jgi:hypothetical protein
MRKHELVLINKFVARVHFNDLTTCNVMTHKFETCDMVKQVNEEWSRYIFQIQSLLF